MVLLPLTSGEHSFSKLILLKRTCTQTKQTCVLVNDFNSKEKVCQEEDK